MRDLILAPKVTFDKHGHKYYYNGKQLSGVTRMVGRASGYKDMTEEGQFILDEARSEGVLIHDSIETWIKTGRKELNTIHPGAVWIKNQIMEMNFKHIQAETLVSDFKQYASAVDIITVDKEGLLSLYDIKRQVNREYVEKQVSIYKYFIEKFTKYKIKDMYAIGFRDQRIYPLNYGGEKEVKKILYTKKVQNKIQK